MKTVEFKRPDNRNLGLEIIRYETGDDNRNNTPHRHRHNFHSLFFILEGSSKQEVDFEDYELGPNMLMLIPKGSIHWERSVHRLSGYVILFKDDFFAEAQKVLLTGLLHYTMALGKLVIPLSDLQREDLIRFFELLNREQNSDTHQNLTFLLQNLMLALLNKIEGIVQQLPEANSFIGIRQLFQQFAAMVEEHYVDQNGLEFYTQGLNVTSKRLNEVVKAVTGQTATAFVIDRLLIEAKRELCFSGRSIKEIAIALGYENQYYFSRIFKSKTGYSPEQFRKAFAE